jgi:hypothetical protein
VRVLWSNPGCRSPPVGDEPIIAAGAVLAKSKGEMQPVIDWAACLRMGNGSIDETEDRKKGVQGRHGLPTSWE